MSRLLHSIFFDFISDIKLQQPSEIKYPDPTKPWLFKQLKSNLNGIRLKVYDRFKARATQGILASFATMSTSPVTWRLTLPGESTLTYFKCFEVINVMYFSFKTVFSGIIDACLSPIALTDRATRATGYRHYWPACFLRRQS